LGRALFISCIGYSLLYMLLCMSNICNPLIVQRCRICVDSRRILSMSLQELTEKLRDGSLSPESVLYPYVKKALEVTRDTNCITVFMNDCETQLQEVKKQKQKGLLYGVPVSIKEHVGYQGHPSTCGLVQYLDELEEEDSVIVKVLKKQGAIIFAKTNVPQTLICYETSNPIYGLTTNPHNHTKGAAGSSGGEGALIGGGGSILGFGTDIGGSIRLPSSFCGIAGLKPTPNRLSLHGVRPCVDGMLAVLLCIGPMARDVDSLVLCMKALLCDEMFKLDPRVPPLPFNEEVYSTSQPLRIGYYETDGYTLPNPAMRRVFLETKKLLEEAGHMVRIKTGHKSLRNHFITLWASVLTIQYFWFLFSKNNIVDQRLRDLCLLCNLPKIVKKILAFILNPKLLLFYFCYTYNLYIFDKNYFYPQEYQTEFIAEWRKLNLDVVLAPMLGPAFNPGYPHSGVLQQYLLYTFLFFLAAASYTQTDEEELKNYKGHFNDQLDKLFVKAVEGGLGLPLSVQCAALPYQDELCLRLMKEVETLHQNKKKKA
uniref:Fatty-acid amide hydrolase 1 n=1 Tax=Xenopus tropicalis TaxID=8364 RepID=F7CQK7_XENTR